MTLILILIPIDYVIAIIDIYIGDYHTLFALGIHITMRNGEFVNIHAM
jgi:hypothetical protein